MDPTAIDWSARPAEFVSEFLPNIVFKFPDGEVAAHKTVLVMVSRVFRNMLIVHNTLDMSAKEIVIEDSRKQPFQIMIDAINNVKCMKESLRGKSIDEMFAVLYVVTKYEIRELELAVKECLLNFPITEDNVLEVATNAMEYLTTFEEAARNVLVSCAKFLEPKFTDAKSFIRYVAENGDRIATVHKLAELMNDLPPSAVCSNCRKSPCLHGTPVQSTQIRPGLKMAKNTHITNLVNSNLPYFYGFNNNNNNFEGEVMEVLSDMMKIKLCFDWRDGEQQMEEITELPNSSCLGFVFKCKINVE